MSVFGQLEGKISGMPAAYKKEEITVSFHYMARFSDDGQTSIPITKDELRSIASYLSTLIDNNFTNEQKNDQIKSRQIAPFDKVDMDGDFYVSGVYKSAYWGHSYENTKAGTITADSINLRPFCFLLYLSESGRLYICSQYLGLFGGYTALSSSIFKAFSNKKGLVTKSFNLFASSLEDAQAKEIAISFSKKGKSITSPNKYGSSTAIVLKSGRSDADFPEQARQDFLSHANKPAGEIRKAIAQTLKEQKLIELDDEEILDCKMVLMHDGHRKTVSLFEPNHFATRIPANVDLDANGHPKYAPMIAKMKSLLTQKVIPIKEKI